jgi:hypothetical protein
MELTLADLTVKLEFEEFCEINEIEINCIIAESGMDKELDFDRESFEESLYHELYKKYPNQIRIKKLKEDYVK